MSSHYPVSQVNMEAPLHHLPIARSVQRPASPLLHKDMKYSAADGMSGSVDPRLDGAYDTDAHFI